MAKRKTSQSQQKIYYRIAMLAFFSVATIFIVSVLYIFIFLQQVHNTLSKPQNILQTRAHHLIVIPSSFVKSRITPLSQNFLTLENSHLTIPSRNQSYPASFYGAPSAAPVQNTSPIYIYGDDTCTQQTLDALTLLAEHAPIHYGIITEYIGTIQCVDQGSGMLAWETPPRYLAGAETRNAGALWYAGTIAHDSCHSKLYNDYLLSHPHMSVPDEVWTGQSAEAECLAVQYDALQQMGASKYYLDYVNSIIQSQYWFISYGNRWW